MLLGEPEREVGDQEQRRRTKEKPFFVILAGFLPASILISLLIILDTGLRRYDGRKVKVFVPPYQSHRSGFDLCFDYNPFCVVEHWRLRAEKSEDCLSDSEFRSACSKLKRTEKPKANTVGWPFF